MNNLQSQLAEIMNDLPFKEGRQSTSVPGVYCVKYSQADDNYAKRSWSACFAIVVQGCKEIILDQDIYRCEDNYYTATPVVLPVISKVTKASPEKPFIAILIDLDPYILSEVAIQLEKDFPKETKTPLRAIFSGKANEKIIEPLIRLSKLFQTPEDAIVLGPLIVKEIFYRLLKEPGGSSIRQFVNSGSKMHKICQIIYKLKSELSDEINVAALAKEANMSRSAFFRSFNDVTSMSPIQYQKRLRLLEARRLMIEQEETAESSAFKVGYKSVSQFSREYSRMFDNSPIRDVIKTKNTNILINSY